MSEATTLGFLGPIATGILGYLVLREPYTRREAAAGGEPVLRAVIQYMSSLTVLHVSYIRLLARHPAVSLIGVILIARPTFLFGAPPRISDGLPVSPDWGDEVSSGSRTSWHDKVYDPDTGALIRHDTPAERLTSVGFALLGVCGASGACESGKIRERWEKEITTERSLALPADITIRAIGHRARPFHSIVYFCIYCVAVSIV